MIAPKATAGSFPPFSRPLSQERDSRFFFGPVPRFYGASISSRPIARAQRGNRVRCRVSVSRRVQLACREASVAFAVGWAAAAAAVSQEHAPERTARRLDGEAKACIRVLLRSYAESMPAPSFADRRCWSGVNADALPPTAPHLETCLPALLTASRVTQLVVQKSAKA
jgi:hypothetical protein